MERSGHRPKLCNPLDVGEERTDHFVVQGDQFEDAHGFIARVGRKPGGVSYD
jgi:hypothetical protein